MLDFTVSTWGLTESELSQFTWLTEQYVFHGIHNPLDARKFRSARIRRIAERQNIITRKENGRWHIEDCLLKRFDPGRELPPEVLWRLFKKYVFRPTGTDTQGYSIRRSAGWEYLNIHPAGQGGQDDTSLMLEVLDRLVRWHYIIFQFAGSIWKITILK